MPGKYRGILVSRKPQDYKKPALESALRTVLFKKLEARAPRLRMLKKKGWHGWRVPLASYLINKGPLASARPQRPLRPQRPQRPQAQTAQTAPGSQDRSDRDCERDDRHDRHDSDLTLRDSL